jgi:hypothetical protein
MVFFLSVRRYKNVTRNGSQPLAERRLFQNLCWHENLERFFPERPGYSVEFQLTGKSVDDKACGSSLSACVEKTL